MSRAKSKLHEPPPFDGSLENEMRASFAWAQMTADARKKFKKAHGTTLQAILTHGLSSATFSFSTFTAQGGKKNFGENLSRHVASKFAAALAGWFPGILPDAQGKGHESRARTSKGYKKLDVNYSTPELGLGLGVSIKTINSVDQKSKRYTKNYTRVDAELRAEAADYHERQPYSTMVAVILLPMEACADGSTDDPSSFGAAVRLFRNRAGRKSASDSHMLFERVFVGLYGTGSSDFGSTLFVDVLSPPPWRGLPAAPISFDKVIREIVREYDERNNPPFEWEDGSVEFDPGAPLSLADGLDDEDDDEGAP